jgi:hypothetical protein
MPLNRKLNKVTSIGFLISVCLKFGKEPKTFVWQEKSALKLQLLANYQIIIFYSTQ